MFDLDFAWWHDYLSLLSDITPTMEATVGLVGQRRMSWKNQRHVRCIASQILHRQHQPPIAKVQSYAIYVKNQPLLVHI